MSSGRSLGVLTGYSGLVDDGDTAIVPMPCPRQAPLGLCPPGRPFSRGGARDVRDHHLPVGARASRGVRHHAWPGRRSSHAFGFVVSKLYKQEGGRS
jgi:hypothetical protein